MHGTKVALFIRIGARNADNNERRTHTMNTNEKTLTDAGFTGFDWDNEPTVIDAIAQLDSVEMTEAIKALNRRGVVALNDSEGR